MMRTVEIEDAEVFCNLLATFRNSQNEGVRGSVDLYRPEWYDERGARMYAACKYTDEGAWEQFAVAAVLANKELVSICAMPGNGQLTERFIAEVMDRERPLFLRCLDTDMLQFFYRRLDFKFLCAMPWNDELKPEGWNIEKYGRPPYTVYVSPYAPCYNDCLEDRLMFIGYDLMADYVKAKIGVDMDCKPFQPRIPARPGAVERSEKDKAFSTYRYFYYDLVKVRQRAEHKGGVNCWRISPFRRQIVSIAWETRKSYHKHLF